MAKKTLYEAYRNYRFSVVEGSSRQSRRRTAAEQARKYRAAMSRNRRVCRRVMTLLRALYVQPEMRYAYLAFAQQIDRLGRKFTARTLENESLALTMYWQSRGLDRRVLDMVRCVAGRETEKSL